MRATQILGLTLFGTAVVLSASIAPGAVGDLTYAKGPLPGVPASTSFGGTTARKASDPAAMGLTHPRALVTAGNSPVMVAFDADDPKAETLNLVRIDRTGKGDFKNAETVKITRAPGTSTRFYRGTFEPQAVEITRNGTKLPVLITGRYYKSTATSYGYVSVLLAARGECRFGDVVRKVVVLDQNRNFAVGDVTTRKVGAREYKYPDACLIADEKGQFGSGSIRSAARIGQPIQMGGKWYTLTGGEMKISAKPLPGPMGRLAITAPKWTCSLTRDGYTMTVNGGSKPVELPPGEYRPRSFQLYREADAKGACPRLYGSLSQSIKIEPGQTTTLALGSGLVMTPGAAVSPGKVRLSARMSDAAGSRILPYGTGGKRPQPPQIEVINQAGKVVYTAKLAYG